MTDWLWKKLSIISGWLTIAVLFGLLVFSANIEIKDLDLWLHLATGRYIVQNNFIPPTVDILSFTISGQPWNNHEWLFQLIVFFVHNIGGIEGLINLRLAIVALTFALLLILNYDEDKSFSPIFVLLLVLLTYQTRLTLRPDVFSVFFFVLFIYFLSYRIDRKSTPFILCFVQILWTNIHGFFILGPLLIIISYLSEFMKRHFPLVFEWNRVGRLTLEEYKRVKITLGLVLLACVCNPQFIVGAIYPFKVLFSLSGDSKVFFQHIVELAHPITWNTLFSTQHYFAYKLLILISFLSFFLNYKKIDVGAIVFWLIFLIFSLSAVRNITYFAVVAYFVYLNNIQDFSSKTLLSDNLKNHQFNYFGSTILKVLLIVWVLGLMGSMSLRGYFDFDTYTRKSEYGGVTLRNYPTKAVDFLIKNKIKGNFFNGFNVGAYLLGRTHPDIKVFIDGRTEVYGSEYYKNYQKIWLGNADLFAKAVEQYGITGVFLNSVHVYAPKKTIRNLYGDPEWKLVYFDYDAAIFLKDIPENRAWIDALEVDLTQYQSEPARLIEIGTKNVNPYQYTNRGYGLFHMGLVDQAYAEVNEALKIKSNYKPAQKLLGLIHLERKEYALSFEHLRKAKNLDPNDLELRYYMAKSLYFLEELKLAESQCLLSLEKNKKNAKGLFLLSKIYAKQSNNEKSLDILKRAIASAPDRIEEVIKVGELFLELEESYWAKEVYTLAQELDPENQTIQKILTDIKH